MDVNSSPVANYSKVRVPGTVQLQLEYNFLLPPLYFDKADYGVTSFEQLNKFPYGFTQTWLFINTSWLLILSCVDN